MMLNFIIKFKGLFSVKFKTFIKKFRDFNGYKGLDRRMLKYINYKDGFYIECGANDGINQSNTWYFEKKLNWNGVLIEPIGEIFNELKKNRNKKNFFFNTALKSFKNEEKFITLNYDKNDSLTTKSNSENELREKIKVNASNLNELLDEIHSPREIDFFSLDVEGDEFNVLDGINFDKYSFKFILIECNQIDKLKIFLKNFNYELLEKLSEGDDYLFRKKKF